jgi:hypothetical protein
MKTYGKWRYSSTILDIGNRWSVNSLTLQATLPRGKCIPLLTRRLGGRESWCGRSEVGKHDFPLMLIETISAAPSHSAVIRQRAG